MSLGPARAPGARLALEFGVIALGQGAAALGSLAGVAVLTRLLDPESYGALALALTIVALTQQLALLPVAGAGLRFFAAARESGDDRPFLAALGRLTALASGAVAVALGLGSLGASLAGAESWARLLIAVLVLSLAQGGAAILDNLLSATRARAIVAWHQAAGQWLRFSAAALAVKLAGPTSLAALGGFALAAWLVMGSEWLAFRNRYGAAASARRPEAVWRGRLVEYAWPFAAWGIFGWAQSASDRWSLEAFGGTASVGLYAVVYQVGYYPLSILATLVMQLVAPVLFGEAGDGGDSARLASIRRSADRMATLATALAVIGAFLAAAAHGWIFGWLVTPAYREVSPLLPLMVLAGGLFGAGQLATLSALSQQHTRSLIAPKVGAPLLGLVMNVAGARAWGLEGVTLAMTLHAAIYWAWVRLGTGRAVA